MYTHITGVILAGGKSSRMGTNKSFLQLNGRTMIERTIEMMRSLFPTILISTNIPHLFSFMGTTCIPDLYKNAGPLAGIHSGLIHAKTDEIFIISCDMPLMSIDVLEFLITHSKDQRVTIAKADGYIQQLCGVYKKTIIPNIETILKTIDNPNDSTSKRCRVLKILDDLKVTPIDFEENYTGKNKNAFYNMNHPQDFQTIKTLLQ